MDRSIPISIKKILVATDGSKHSKKGIELAIDLAKLWKAKTYLLHVWEKRNIPQEFKTYAKDEQIPKSLYYDLVERQLFKPVESRLKKDRLDFEAITAQGDPANEILKAAEKESVDLIIMGSRGLGGFSRTIMGSVSTKVCNHAHCTCITVK